MKELVIIFTLSQIHYIVMLISFLSCSHKTHDRKIKYLVYILSYLHPYALIYLSVPYSDYQMCS